MWTLSSRLGAMFTAASLMISASSWPGTSMTKQWLIRRAVRSPVSRATTAAISSSVCRLPFISASARPARTSSTALAAAAWLCSTSTISNSPMSKPCLPATLWMRALGPTRIGSISSRREASTALSSAASSHGWAIAVAAGASRCARSTRRRNFWWSCGRGSVSVLLLSPAGPNCPAAASRRRAPCRG